MTTTTAPYNIDVAVMTLGHLCKKNGIQLSEMREVFPHRPATREQALEIAAWIEQRIRSGLLQGTEQTASVNPPHPSSSQVKGDWSGIATRKDKNGKALPSYYCIDIDGTTKFYRVKQGRKPGYYFVEVQASDELHPIRHYGSVIAILNTIAKDPKAAMERYGQEIGSCGHCHRTLTDETSRAYGIGPKCRKDGY